MSKWDVDFGVLHSGILFILVLQWYEKVGTIKTQSPARFRVATEFGGTGSLISIDL